MNPIDQVRAALLNAGLGDVVLELNDSAHFVRADGRLPRLLINTI
jgi:hypothetical protein